MTDQGTEVHDTFGTDREVELAGVPRRLRCLQRLAEQLPGVDELPVTTRILVEDLLRHDDGSGAAADSVRALVAGAGSAEVVDVLFHPGRVLMQDFTGVPAIADLAAVRDAVGELTGVVGRFVEFHGEGLVALPAEARATISNMSPEYGSTAALFPIDDETLAYLRRTGRDEAHVALVEAYARHQGLWRDDRERRFADGLVVRLDEVEPCLAGPSLPQQRVPLAAVPSRVAAAISTVVRSSSGAPEGADPSEADRAIRTRRPGVPSNGRPVGVRAASADDASAQSFPASDPPALDPDDPVAAQTWVDEQPDAPISAADRVVPVRTKDGTFELTDGHVVIAAITSCTNTSNPAVMVGAGLLARNAVARGLRRPPWVKTSLAPGSPTVVRYLEDAGLADPLAELGFHVVGFGCTTCIGNSGPLMPEVSAAIRHRDLAVCAVLSGNRNFEGRIHPDVRMNFLASPPLVVAAALAGHMQVDLSADPLGYDDEDRPVTLADLWPSDEEVAEVVRDVVRPQLYAVGAGPDERVAAAPPHPVSVSPWKDGSTYVRRPPFAKPLGVGDEEVSDIVGARVLAVLDDNVTTDHISPAGVIDVDSPAGRWLLGQNVDPVDFNSYGSRRGNHEVMVRGTFANPRLRNRLAGDRAGGWTRHLPDGELMTIHEAATRYAAERVPLVVLAGVEYGTGSSRDWAAKGTRLLGVRAVIARSFERIHRTNLVGMGVLPLQLPERETVESLGLTGEEVVDVVDLVDADGELRRSATLRAGDVEVPLTVRVDTPRERAYIAAGGILPYVVGRIAGDAAVA
jgi:aconitate hydratase